MRDTQAQHLWDATLGELQLQVPRSTYETWLRGTQGLQLQGSLLIVGAPSPFVAECLETRLSSLLVRTLERVAHRPLEITFQVVETREPQPKGNGRRVTADAEVPAPQSLPLTPPGLHPQHTFSTFVTGPSNELAFASAQAVAQQPGEQFNPLFLYSGVGLGKTHLLHAIASAVSQRGMTWLYVTADQFTNEFVTGIQRGQTEAFRRKYSGTDMLLVDDIQFLGGKERSQEAFFHTFNLLHRTSRQVVIASDRSPQMLPLVQDRLRSRFEGGLTVDIQPPALETRMAILSTKLQKQNLSLPPEILLALAERTAGSVRHLEGCLNHVIALAHLRGRPIDASLLPAVLNTLPVEVTPPPTSPQELLALVATTYRVPPEALKAKERGKTITHARHIAMYLLRSELHYPLKQIGQLLGGFDHSSVLYACTKIDQELRLNSELQQQVQNLRNSLHQQTAHPDHPAKSEDRFR